MKIQIRANAHQKEVLLTKNATAEIIWENEKIVDADVFIDFLFDSTHNFFKSIKDKPVLINCVTVNEHFGENIARFNGWNSFIEKEKLEVFSNDESTTNAILKAIGYAPIFVRNIDGFIAARNIAMIINEAYFALEDEISSKEQIDTAMKLGTNYPYGPFEWEEKIGKKNIVELLTTLSITDKRYTPSNLLLKQ